LIFDKKRLQEFLRKLDSEINQNIKLYIIGGAAATLAYDSKQGTVDIDTWGEDKNLQAAYLKVIKKHPRLKLPFGPAKVHIQSVAMLNRFVLYEKIVLRNLMIKVPLPEDLFLLKAQRADEKDIFDLIELHKKMLLDPQKILKWFKADVLPHNPGNDDSLINNYLFCVAKVFGQPTAKTHTAKIKNKQNP